ncbi:hypothetical protein CFR78_13795 [Komagataeibacter rhaeticus]|uniref:hypothetical protein n=1 Tax=Komagataeibacter rhaeticus TaxID=215221 RepID=UPI0004D581BE|nr:hypothetical protein [Komagataeibacter rhaeticus]KDU95990.1 hypothetical protein GLUCORHAEAF1_05125 [Komagataeibacter rhaeticus AF1]MDT8871956.1 hypothetical protein [Komagataeibacter rhaeticus]PYD52586.1 hypothetical protein CFR78_13795 [Komagataeibacter rhaeticus]GBQ16908.1 hypothetical protein AA16663_2550 [Komagataeibacter rhaeticus DSM 16663]
MRPDNDNASPAIVHFPRRNILSPVEASAYLGIRPLLLNAMKWLRCGPKAITINRRRVYTEDELRGFRNTLMSAVGVAENGGAYRLLAAGERAPAADPLITLLARNLVWRRAILVLLWGMMALGIGIDLILF